VPINHHGGKEMRINRRLQIIALTVILSAVAATSARADSFTVTLNTSALSGAQTLAFGFTDGDGVVDNSATMSAFNFGGGSAQGLPSYLGTGVSGNLTSGVAMDDSGFSALFAQQFIVGSALSFTLNVTNNFAGGTPDAFAMYVCDASLSTCYSDDINTGAMLVLNPAGGTLSPSSFILNAAGDQNLPAPVVTLPGTSVPEPPSLLFLVMGLAGVLLASKLRL
jgi:hypothetical protein